jgi:hypothetical protein
MGDPCEAGDDAGVRYKAAIAADLRADDRVAEVIDVGVSEDEDTHDPHVAVAAARLISEGKADRALLVCGTGLGVAISAKRSAASAPSPPANGSTTGSTPRPHPRRRSTRSPPTSRATWPRRGDPAGPVLWMPPARRPPGSA